ncbi:hypothetical protein CISIN_1g048633mg, partial [Citrus sinensis]
KICNMHIFTCQKLDANQDLRRKKIKDLLGYAEEHCRAESNIVKDLFDARNNTTSITTKWAMAELLHNPEALSKATSRDESTRDHAHSFMPKRFLGSEVDFIGRNFESIPFGAGRRICPDLPLDITMLYPL